MEDADSPEVQRFVADAGAFCHFIDQLRSDRRPGMYAQLLVLLSNLASSAVRVRWDMPDSDEWECVLPGEERAAVSRLLSGIVTPDISRLAMPDDDGGERIRRDMFFDDLADIYADLKGPMQCYESGTPDGKRAAIWQWRFGYERHWGYHLMRALQTTHELCFDALAD